MASVINSLLVGIGFAVDQKSTQNVESAIDGITSKALQLTSVVAGAFGANALTFGFAGEFDALGKLGERWGLAAEDVAAYDRALQHAGGTTGEFFSSVQNLTQLQALAGQDKAGLLAGLAPQGISDQVSRVINATDALEGFLSAADSLGQLDAAGQERFIQALGFTDSEVRLLRAGRDGILSAVAAEKQFRPITDQMTTSAANFNDAWQDLTTNIGGFSDRVAVPLTAAITSILIGMNDWIGANRELVNSFLEIGGGVVADNIEIVAGGLALLASGTVIAGLKSVAVLVAGISSSIIAGAAAAAPFVAAASVLTMGGKGEKFSAGGVFGENAVTKFLDMPLSEHASEIERLFDFGPLPIRSGPGSASSGLSVTIPISLDGRVIETKVVDVLNEQAEQAVQDLSNSEGN